ncbi:pLS20_p028 family conjugation system transmembrane protein [Fructilactobacillus cliffordii]|uniref:DUF8208 domain-containing protein n=1 Tax=Fructilactobacillus cliffordii TaxID=2940299 RepID=A0A9Q8ZUJ7_9LACO|nr:hypothetical protein [Fructilactobacillus cliffordii]USS89998.1 hypothetical protein M3M40_07175 [Fructilactobacillus cliffordii]
MFDYFRNILVLASYNIPDAIKNSSANTVSSWFHFNQPNGKEAIHFYQIWKQSGYLDYHNVFAIKFMGLIKQMFLMFFYNVAHGMEQILNAILSIFGIFDNFGSGPFATIRVTVFGLAVGFLFVSLTWLAISTIWGKSDKYLKGLKSAVMFTAVVIILPFVVSSFGNITKSGANAISHDGHSSSMAITPIRKNIIDVIDLANADFDVNPDKLNPEKDQLNDFTDQNIGSVDFGEVVTKENIKLVDDKKHPGGSKVFNYAQSDNNLTEHALPSNNDSGIKNAFSGGYARYTGQFFIAIMTEMVLALALLVIAFRVVKSVYQILLVTIVAPLIFYANLQKPSRIKDILSSITGASISIWSELIGVKVFFIFASSLDTNPATKALQAMGGGPFQVGILELIILLGSFTGFLFGVQLIERWTGVPGGTGHGMLGFMLGGAMAAKGVSGVGKATAATAKGTGKAASAVGKGIKSLDSDSMSAQASRSSSGSSKNPALNVVGDSNSKNNDPSASNLSNSSNDKNGLTSGKNKAKSTDNSSVGDLNSDNGSDKNSAGISEDNGANPASEVNDESNGTDESSTGVSEDNGANPASEVNDESNGTDESSTGVSEDNGANPASEVNDESNGTDESSTGVSEDNGANPASEVNDESNGTDESSTGISQDNGANPASEVNDESNGTGESSTGVNEDEGENPASEVNYETNGTDGTDGSFTGVSGDNGTNPTSTFNGKEKGTNLGSSNISSDDGNNPSYKVGKHSPKNKYEASSGSDISRVSNENGDSTSDPAGNSNDGITKPKQGISNQDLMERINTMSKQQAKTGKRSLSNRVEDTANSLSRMQQENRNTLGTPDDKDEF